MPPSGGGSGSATDLRIDALIEDVDAWFQVLMGAITFMMQIGFALLEAGSVRAKNTKSILMKNLLDASIGAMIWYAWGYALAYDGVENGFVGTFDSTSMSAFLWAYNDESHEGRHTYANWWFQYCFCATTATVVSGSMAERITLAGYLTYTVILVGIVYPVVVHWGWSKGQGDGSGWAYEWNGGLLDFAGGGVVHMTGGVAALVGAAIVGPRRGRFDDYGRPLPVHAHSTVLQVLGTLFLWTGFYGLLPGKTAKLVGYSQKMSRCVATSTLSATTGGLTVLLVNKLCGTRTWDVSQLCNGVLAGMVSIAAGAAGVYPYAAMAIGTIGGLVYKASSVVVLRRCRVDDPLDSFAVHGACGFWSVVAAALFSVQGLSGAGRGVFEGGEGCWDHLAAGMAFCLANWAWTGSWAVLMFFPLKLIGKLRVPESVELAGMDISKMGGPACIMDDGRVAPAPRPPARSEPGVGSGMCTADPTTSSTLTGPSTSPQWVHSRPAADKPPYSP